MAGARSRTPGNWAFRTTGAWGCTPCPSWPSGTGPAGHSIPRSDARHRGEHAGSPSPTGRCTRRHDLPRDQTRWPCRPRIGRQRIRTRVCPGFDPCARRGRPHRQRPGRRRVAPAPPERTQRTGRRIRRAGLFAHTRGLGLPPRPMESVAFHASRTPRAYGILHARNESR